MPFLVVEECRVARLHPKCREDGVLMGERKPAKRGEVEDEALWRYARPSSGRPDCGYGLTYTTAEELGDPASIAERLALDQTDEVPVVPEEVDEGGDELVNRVLGCVVLAPSRGARHGVMPACDDALEDRVVKRLLAPEEVGGRASRDPGRLGDVVEARTLEAQAREGVLGCDEDRFTRPLCVSSPSRVLVGHANTSTSNY